MLGEDLLEVIRDSLSRGQFPLCCRRTRDRGLGSEALRLRKVMSEVFRVDQTYCVPGRSVSDNMAWLRYVLETSSSLDKATGLISIDQEEAFDWMHQYFVAKFKCFWVQLRIHSQEQGKVPWYFQVY